MKLDHKDRDESGWTFEFDDRHFRTYLIVKFDGIIKGSISLFPDELQYWKDLAQKNGIQINS